MRRIGEHTIGRRRGGEAGRGEPPHGREMPLDPTLLRRMEEALTLPHGHAPTGPRLLDDARRLRARLNRLLALNLVHPPPQGVEADALELACFALQLPARPAGEGSSRDPDRPAAAGRTSLRDRCEDAAELLIMEFGAVIDEALLDHAARVLREAPHRPPMLDAARLLADAINLEDFGVLGIVGQVIQLYQLGQGAVQLADGLEKRDLYGYWDARLNEGFHFDAVREMARERLEHARRIAAMLRRELDVDPPAP
jgi:hypothetical protein